MLQLDIVASLVSMLHVVKIVNIPCNAMKYLSLCNGTFISSVALV